MKGPATLCSFRCASSATDCTVLPSPISSPRIPLSPFSYRPTSQCTPTCGHAGGWAHLAEHTGSVQLFSGEAGRTSW